MIRTLKVCLCNDELGQISEEMEIEIEFDRHPGDLDDPWSFYGAVIKSFPYRYIKSDVSVTDYVPESARKAIDAWLAKQLREEAEDAEMDRQVEAKGLI